MRSDWKTYRLSEIGKIIGGGTPSTKSSSYWGKGYPWITPKDLSNYNNRYISCGARSITADGLSNSSARLLPPKTVLITSRAPIGYLAIAETEVTTNQGFKSIVPNEKLCTSEFVYYLMKSNVDTLVQYSSGSTFQEISGKVLGSLEFSFPPLPEQRRIAALLGALDDKIELNRKMNQTLEEMAQAIFKSWFIDFDGVPEEDLVESELGLIPRGWEVGTLGDLIKFQNGYAFKSKDWQETGVPVVKIGSVKPQIVNLNKVSFVSEQVAKKAARFRLNIGDILVGMTGYVGEVGRVPPTNTPPLLNQRVGRIVFDERQEAYEFVYCLMRNSTFKTYVENMASGSAQANVSGEAISNYPILIPPKEELLIFGSKSGALMTHILTNCEINTTLAELRDTLLPKLISGELRIPEAEERVTDALS